MSTEEAKEYVDVIVETLVDWGVISQERYGRMSVDQMNELAEKVKEKSEE